MTKQNNPVAIVQDSSDLECYLDTARFDHNLRVANLLSSANLVPKHYRGSVADCFIALSQAALMKIDPMLFMQKTYPVGGKIGIESQLAIALANKAGVFQDVIQYELSGKEGSDGWTCRAFATTKGGAHCEETCSVKDAKEMGWWSRAGSPWPKQTKKMLRYRAAMNLIRLYCPEVLFGLDSKEELIDWEATQKPSPTKDITKEVQELQTEQADILPDMTSDSAENAQTELVESIEQLREWVNSDQCKTDMERIPSLTPKVLDAALLDNTGEKAQNILDLIRQSK